jgi:hypothetical protein
MNTRLNGKATDRGQSIAEVVEIACNLAGTDDIRAVHVVSGERPTYDDLLRYRRWADVSLLNLSVDASSVSFRSNRRYDEEASGETTRKLSWPHHFLAHGPWRAALTAYSQGVKTAMAENTLSSALSWLSAHGRAWFSEFTLMSEGTR